jgi:hypothetical protein
MWRRIFRIACAGLVIAAALAGAPAARADETDLDKKIEKDLAEDNLELLTKDLGISLWDETVSIRNGIGYKDNILLDESNPKKSPFFVNGLDATVFRLPIGFWTYYLSVSGDDIRYWKDVGVGSEDLWLVAGKAKYDSGNGWQEGVTVSYAYEAEVLDLLTGEGITGMTPAKVNGNTITLLPYVRRDLFSSNYWAQLGAEGTRQFLTSPGFSYWCVGPKFTLGMNYGHRSEISASYALYDQPFNGEPDIDLDGNDIPGTDLVYFKQKAEAYWRHNWDKDRLWSNTTKGGYEWVHDNGSGYFNYRRYFASEQLDYDGSGWTITALATFEYYLYPDQTVNDTPGTELYQTGLTFDLHVERKIVRWLKLFADYQYEKAFSNESTEHYRDNTVKGGVSWEF